MIERYHGVLYPNATEPSWSPSTPQEVIDAIDEVLSRDARYFGLLFQRAHMLEVAGSPVAADRDLEWVFRLGGDPTNSPHSLTKRVWGELYRAWILTVNRPKQAIEALSQISEIPVPREAAAGRTGDFLARDEYFSRINDAAPLRRLLNHIKTR